MSSDTFYFLCGSVQTLLSSHQLRGGCKISRPRAAPCTSAERPTYFRAMFIDKFLIMTRISCEPHSCDNRYVNRIILIVNTFERTHVPLDCSNEPKPDGE